MAVAVQFRSKVPTSPSPQISVTGAIGYGADPKFAKAAPFDANRWHLIEVDKQTGQTHVPYVFAGGDAVQGADLVVTAIADSKRTAIWLRTYLLRLGLIEE